MIVPILHSHSCPAVIFDVLWIRPISTSESGSVRITDGDISRSEGSSSDAFGIIISRSDSPSLCVCARPKLISYDAIVNPMTEVLILMGSKSDLPVAEKAVAILKKFDIDYEMAVASAHRTPERVESLVKGSDASVFIAIAGMAAALPGVMASFTTKPVIGVPVSGKMTLDAILSIVQMPPGIPVASVGLDRGDNAAVLAAEILSVKDEGLQKKLAAYRKEMADKVIKDSEEVSNVQS